MTFSIRVLDGYRICSCSLLVRRELIITIRHFTEKSSCDSFAITSFLIMIPFILQKPSRNSKTAEHKVHLKRILEMWRLGKIGELVREGEQIQIRLKSKQKNDEDHWLKVFVRLMLEGNVRSAMKWLTSKVRNGAPIEINEETLNQLTAKHPPRPIGIGEVLRRVIVNAIMRHPII